MQVELSVYDLDQLSTAAIHHANKRSHEALIALREGDRLLSQQLDEEALKLFTLHDRLEKYLCLPIDNHKIDLRNFQTEET